jgi:hypothetical protein
MQLHFNLKALNLDNVRIIPPLIGCHLLSEGSIPPAHSA